MALSSLKLFDFSDRELLLVVMEQADHDIDGHANTKDIADALGVEGDYRLSSVGSRLAAMRRMGVVVKEEVPSPDRDRVPWTRWAVSPVGRMMAMGSIDEPTKQQLASLGPEQMILLTRFLSGRYRAAPSAAGHLIRREWVAGSRRNGRV